MTLYVAVWSLNSVVFCIIYLALCGWNLSQTFKLSNDMVLVKEKISNIEDKVSKFKPNKRNKKNKKRKQN